MWKSIDSSAGVLGLIARSNRARTVGANADQTDTIYTLEDDPRRPAQTSRRRARVTKCQQLTFHLNAVRCLPRLIFNRRGRPGPRSPLKRRRDLRGAPRGAAAPLAPDDRVDRASGGPNTHSDTRGLLERVVPPTKGPPSTWLGSRPAAALFVSARAEDRVRPRGRRLKHTAAPFARPPRAHLVRHGPRGHPRASATHRATVRR